jgi:Aminoglycoside/hydroxyurea antibiotic resistance kinase
MGSTVPGIDAAVRQRLTARFGSEVEAWFEQLPGVLTALAQRWQFELGSPIPRGSVSAVFRCRMADGRRAVLKASPDRARLAFEAAALDAWHTVHTPAVIALDEQLGALLIEAIAIDPAPCLGDAALDAVDLILWQADDLGTIEARTRRLAAATGVQAGRLFGWCVAFAAMSALERASQGNGSSAGMAALLELASQA